MQTTLSHRYSFSLCFAALAALVLAACGGSVTKDGPGSGGAAGSGGGSASGGSAGTGGGTCNYGGNWYHAGESFPAGDGCNTCSCSSDGSVGCTLMSCSSGCDYQGQHYEPGQTFPAGDNCNSCTCEAGGGVSCTEMDCPGPACVYGGKPYDVGQSFPSLDGCNTCSCAQPKVVSCTTKACPCDPSKEWWKKYLSTDPKTCEVIDFACADNTTPFENQCGCGCAQDPSCPPYIDCMPPTDCTELKKKCPFSGIAY